jgi:uncharacterized protein (DUF433 family)
MTLTLSPQTVPLREHDDGTVRIGETRVLLEVFITAFNRDGLPPAELLQAFPSLTEQEVYGVLAYYVANQDDVDAYVARQARALIDFMEADPAYRAQQGLWAELRARRAAISNSPP